jgi:hypothetical protein
MSPALRHVNAKVAVYNLHHVIHLPEEEQKDSEV